MSKTRLCPGEDNISSRRVTDDPRGGYRLQWNICLWDGRILSKTTRGKNMTKGQVKERARETAQQLLQQSGNSERWSTLSSMSDFIAGEARPMVESAPLAKSSHDRYLQILGYLAEELKGYSIARAVIPERLQKALNSIALEHGTATARQTKKVANKWVVKRFVFLGVINRNPLNNAGIRITVEHKAADKPAGGVAIRDGDYERAVDYMLGLDPEAPPRKSRGRPPSPAKRRSVIELALLQSTTGLRISECRHLVAGDVFDKGGETHVAVRPESSKTKRGREIPILDGRVAKLVREHVERLSPGDLVFPSPDAPGRVWDRHNCNKAVNSFLQREVAEECGIDILKTHGSHIWRATLSSRAARRGIPPEIRAAYFGHSADVDRDYYTDLTDTSTFVSALMKRKDG